MVDEFHPFASRGASLSRSAFRDHPHPSDETARCLPIPIWASDLLPFSEMKLFYIALKLEKYFTLNGALCGDHYEGNDTILRGSNCPKRSPNQQLLEFSHNTSSPLFCKFNFSHESHSYQFMLLYVLEDCIVSC